MTSKQLKEQARRYARVVQWSDKDQCFIGSCPNFPAIAERGTDEVKVYGQLCRKVETWIELMEIGSLLEPLPPKFVPDLELLMRRATEAIRELEAQTLSKDSSATRSGSAAWKLHRLAYIAVEALGRLTNQRPDLVRPIAETSMVWPAFISPHRDYAQGNAQLLDSLGVGRRSLLKVVPKKGQKRQWSFLTPATQIAVTLVREIEGFRACYRAKARDESDPDLQRLGSASDWKPMPQDCFSEDFLALQNFSVSTAPRWADVGWKLIMQQSGGHPERFFDLKRMGEHRRTHTEHTCAQKRATPATGDSNVRDGFHDRLKKAFGVLAREAQRKPR